MFFRGGSERLHRKAYLSKTRKVSKYQTFACALHSQYSEKNEKAQEKCPCRLFFRTAISQLWVTACKQSTFA